MRKFLLAILVPVFVLCGNQAHGASISATSATVATSLSSEEILAKIVDGNAGRKNITGTFVHTKVLATRAKKEMNGSVSYQASDKLAMIYSNPSGDRFVINGNKVYMNRSGKAQLYDITKVAMVRRMASNILDAVAGKVSSLAADNDADMLVMDSGDNYVIILTARQEATTGYARTCIEYRKSDCMIVKLEMEEFSHVVNSFSFNPLAGATVKDASVFDIPSK